ncbi:hypothetical protein OpiT1DRAFT_00139 [Opitutaceae bacterium TAV1]|nr:hypothetical protein OpiT1DRAFT_00139 [Opitutaceae bacterium TAV1]
MKTTSALSLPTLRAKFPVRPTASGVSPAHFAVLPEVFVVSPHAATVSRESSTVFPQTRNTRPAFSPLLARHANNNPFSTSNL